jgi:peptide/nickel transport system substrate-binding protein
VNRTQRSATLRRNTLLIGGIAAVGVLLAGCGGAPAGSSAGDTAVVVMPSQATQVSWDSGYVNSEDYIDLQTLLNGTLVRMDYVESDAAGVITQDISNFEGYLAESYEVSDDGLTYTFHLAEDVVSQAGNPLTADDVVWSFERKFDENTAGISAGLLATAGLTSADQVTKIDDQTVSISIPRASDGYTLLGSLSLPMGIVYDSTFLQEHATDEDPYAVAWAATSYDNYGFGPYEIESLTEGAETVLVANEDHVGGAPAIDRLVRRVVPEVGNRLNAVRSGDADVAVALRPSDMASLASEPNVFVPDIATNQRLFMTLVVNKAPFDRLEVRQALAHAVDYDRIIDEVYSGQAERQYGFLNPDLNGYTDAGIPKWEYDPAAAKALLAQAGITEPVDVTLTVSNADPIAADIAVILRDAASDAGFALTIEELTPAQVSEKQDKHLGEAYIGWGAPWNLSPPYVLQWVNNPDSTDTAWTSEAFFAALDRGYAAGDVTTEEAGKAWNEAEVIWMQDAPNIPIAGLGTTVAFSSDLTGWTWRTDGGVDLSQASFVTAE